MLILATDIEYFADGQAHTLFLGNEEQEKAFVLSGINGENIYAELNDQSQSCYGGVQNVLLSDQKIKVSLNLEGKKRLGTKEIVVNFYKEDYAELKKYLPLILGEKLLFEEEKTKPAKPKKEPKPKPKREYGQVKYLSLENKNLKTLPEYVKEMVLLETAKLQGNPKLNVVEVFETLKNFPNLKYLTLETSQLIPESIGELTNLEHLTIVELDSQVLPASLGNLKKLHYLYLRGKEKLELPDTLAQLTHLETLRVHAKSWNLPKEFYRLSNLQSLDFQRCTLREFPAEVAQMSKLKTVFFDLFYDDLDFSKVLPVLAQMPTLQNLHIRSSHLCQEIGLCQNLQELTICDYVPLSAEQRLELPKELFDLSQLKKLLFKGVHLAEIPSEIGKLKSLNNLCFLKCDFVSLPEAMGELETLDFLNISQNFSLDHLPENIGKLPALKTLVLRQIPNLKTLPSSLKDRADLEILLSEEAED